MKGLVVYYSRTGTTKKAGEAISALLNYDKEQLFDVKSRKGALGWLKSGREAAIKTLAEIKDIKKKPAEYEIVVIGTPVWAGKISSPIRTYITANKDDFKKTAFFCTMGGAESKMIFKEMQNIIGKEPVAVLELKTKDVINNNHMNKVNEFVNKIK